MKIKPFKYNNLVRHGSLASYVKTNYKWFVSSRTQGYTWKEISMSIEEDVGMLYPPSSVAMAFSLQGYSMGVNGVELVKQLKRI